MNTCGNKWVVAWVALGCALCESAALAASRHQDTILVDRTHQVIENFGASDCWTLEKIGTAWSEANRERISDLLFSRQQGIGLSAWRFNLGAGRLPGIIRDPRRTVESFARSEGAYDWSRQAGQQWFLRAARRRGVLQFLAFANSPPLFLTRNGRSFCSEDGTTNLKPDAVQAYADYLADILAHFRNHPDETRRIPFGFVSPVNEPQWGWDRPSQEGNRASNDDIRGIVQALHRTLQKRQLPVSIITPESGSLPDMVAPSEKAGRIYGAPFGEYARLFPGDQELGPLLDRRLAYHSYWSDDVARALRPHRRALGRAMADYPDWKTWQTEYCVMERGRDLGIDTALRVARILHVDLTEAQVSAWHWWLALSPYNYKDGLLFTDWKKPGDPETILVSKTFWALGHFSRFIRPGMQRIELQGDHHGLEGLMGSAYRNAATGALAVVYINLGEEPAEVQLTLRNSVSRRAIDRALIPFLTTGRDGVDHKRYPAVRTNSRFQVPARSLVTLYAPAREP